ncbi:hypothetical protein TrVE_jg8853 [Triparma verrucosa]|uniref:RRM domain-containing protein n=1 Tax=Triparma verrucosa TaxID=1606542 RepID=A0A9W7KYJ1_9STRA|nr:hypothetical protein TrVE_jg8853 [Triparma verrucosa]
MNPIKTYCIGAGALLLCLISLPNTSSFSAPTSAFTLPSYAKSKTFHKSSSPSDDWSISPGQGVSSTDGYVSGSSETVHITDKDDWTKSQRPNRLERHSLGMERRPRGRPNPMKKQKDNTRVFVQNLPPTYKWADLKDLFKHNLPADLRTTVAFASVSMTDDGTSKGCGIVQMETIEGVEEVIRLAKDGHFNVMEGGETYEIFVRMDIKERNIRSETKSDPNRAIGESTRGGRKGYYSCANLDLESRSTEMVSEVSELVESRAAARGRRNFEASDNMRRKLLDDYSVRVDDRTMLWWFDETGGRVPDMVADSKSDGSWKSKDWACVYENGYETVNSDEVEKLLKRRDRLRVNRDYTEADEVLERVYAMGGEEGKIVVDDKKKLWKVVKVGADGSEEGEDVVAGAGGGGGGGNDSRIKCLELIGEHAPEKLEEVAALLDKFEGKEDTVYERLKERYTTASE